MTAATKRRPIIQHGEEGVPRLLPGKLAANAITKRGWHMLRNASGYITQTAATGCTSAGVAEEDADNTGGADGALSVNLRQGVMNLTNGASGDALADGDAPCACYFLDNQTVGKLPSDGAVNHSRAGVFLGIDPDGVGQAKVLVGQVGDMLARSIEGQREQVGTVTLVSGTKTINTGITVTANSKVFVSVNTPGGTDGINYSVPDSSLVVGGPGTGSITINSISSAGAVVTTDTSTVNYLIVG